MYVYDDIRREEKKRTASTCLNYKCVWIPFGMKKKTKISILLHSEA